MKKTFAIFLLLVLCLSFSGCDFVFDSVESLMRPPKLNGEDSVLQRAFEQTVEEQKDVVMETPTNGKYRSSYILFDIDNDSQEEAIVLYSIPADNNFVIAKIFKFSNENWINISQINGLSDEIYEVNFADINGDGCYEILLSWNGTYVVNEELGTDFDLGPTLTVYSFDNDDTKLILSEKYSYLYTSDLNNNKSDEIVIFKINPTDIVNRTIVRILSYNKNYSVQYDNTKSITGMVEINNVISDRVSNSGKSISRIYVDGVISESGIITEIIEINEADFNMMLPLYVDNQSSAPKTLRDNKIYCIDIDEDGYLEIPTIEDFPYAQKITETKTEPLNLISWIGYENDKFNIDFKCLVNAKLGFLLVIPEEFIGKVSVIYDVDNMNLNFYSIDSNGSFNNILFSCKIFEIPDWEDNNFNYIKHYENDTYVYGYLIFKSDNRDIFEKFIEENFYAL